MKMEAGPGQENRKDTGKGSDVSVCASDFNSQRKRDSEVIFCLFSFVFEGLLLANLVNAI